RHLLGIAFDKLYITVAIALNEFPGVLKHFRCDIHRCHFFDEWSEGIRRMPAACGCVECMFPLVSMCHFNQCSKIPATAMYFAAYVKIRTASELVFNILFVIHTCYPPRIID